MAEIDFDDVFDSLEESAYDASESLENLASSSDKVGRGMVDAAKEAQALISTLSNIEKNTRGANEGLNAFTSAFKQLTTTQKESQEAINTLTSQISQIEGRMANVSRSISNFGKSLKETKSDTQRGGEEIKKMTQSIDSLSSYYKKLGINLDEMKIELSNLIVTEKEYNKVIQLATEFNEERAGSYDSLSAKYRAFKILYDKMTDEEIAKNQAFVGSLRSMYEQMNILQQATGKYQLQVGDYSKAMTGLNIATNQVVRELPVIANGWSMFAIAISNNIPILLDAIQAVERDNAARIAKKTALEEEAAAAILAGNATVAASKRSEAAAIRTTTAIQGIKAAVFSWQTAIVLLLTVLPNLIRKIEESNKKKKEAAQATKDLITYEKLYHEALQGIANEEGRGMARLDALRMALEDSTRAYEDRLAIARAINEEFGEMLGNYSAEEIAAGKSSRAIRELTKSLKEQSEQRAILDKITELYGKRLDLEVKKELNPANKTMADAIKKMNDLRQEWVNLPSRAKTGQAKEGYDAQIKYWKGIYDAAHSAIEGIDIDIQEIGQVISSLEKKLDGKGILDSIMGGKKKKDERKELSIDDYYLDYLQSIIDAMEEGSPKVLKQIEMDAIKRRAKLKEQEDALLAMLKDANKEEAKEIMRQVEYIHRIRENGDAEYLQARKKFLDELVASYREEVEDEVDFADEEIKAIKTRLGLEKSLRESAIRKEYEDYALRGEFTATMQEEMNERLKALDREYWESYLKELTNAGLLTIQAYNEIMSNLEKAQDTQEKKRAGKRRRKYANPIEALMAQTGYYGEDDKYGLRVIKEQFKAYSDGVNDALKSSISYMREWIDARKEMADVAIEAAKAEVDAAKQVLDYEMEARANGYAYNMELARKEYNEKLALQRKAEEDSRRLARVQQSLDTTQQISSLLTATANIWAAEGLKGLLGVPLALAATGAMWASFAAAKVQAYKLTDVKYGEGMSEYLNYGGSHASGNDIDFGTTKDGRRRRVERGEVIGVINKKNVNKYGANEVQNIINSLNSGTFEEKYGGAFSGASSPILMGADLSKLERDVWNIRKQGETRTTYANGKTIVQYKNVKRIING